MENELDNLHSQIELLKGEIELQERNYKAAVLKYSSYPNLKKIKAKIKELKSRLDDLMNKDE
jgi:hypothetical protein